MVDARGGKAGGTNGGGGGSLAGYATQAWVNEGFVSVDFFNRLFTVYGPGETSSDPDVVIEPNDLDSTIKNIKAMFGLWTEQYLSALGLNPGGTGSATSLSMLDDVDITTPTNGQALVYNATSLKWENQTISTVTALANLTDVLLTSPADGQTLLYDSANAKWYNSALKTINGQSLLGSGDISVGGGASGNYLPLTGGTLLNNTQRDSILTINNSYGVTSVKCCYGAGAGMYVGTSLSGSSGYILWCCTQTGLEGVGATTRFIVLPNGNCGIKKYSPEYELDIVGNARAANLLFYNRAYNGNAGYVGRGSSVNDNIQLTAYTNNGLGLGANGTDDVLFIATTLRVGIGTTTPAYKLNVNGTFGVTGSSSSDPMGHISNESNGISTFRCSYYGGYGAFIGSSKSDSTYILNCCSSIRGIGGEGAVTRFIVLSNGNIGVGTSSPSYTLHVSGSIYATGAITALSDIKQKNIKEYMQIGIDEVANAPIIKFTWKDPKAEDKGLQVGSIAQYWEKVLPEAVKRDKEGTLSMSYGVVALVAAISTAKKVRELDERVTKLEKIER